MSSKHANTDGDSRPLHRMFTRVPGNYDLMNRILTFRLDEVWRKKAARKCMENHPGKVLDLCTGTGDLLVHLIRQGRNGQSEYHALDFSRPMLDIAEKKARKKIRMPVKFTEGDVAALPWEEGYFDSIGIGFAFRNLTYRNPRSPLYLSEIFRVLNTGGRFVIIETAQPQSRIMKTLFKLYMQVVTAGVGGLLSGHPGAYRYLAHSAINYYSTEEVEKLLLSTGFSRVESTSMLGGIAALYVAVK